ncbi:MAG TPA: beta-eliminating lyase-related protein [Spirochaetales bacterium]|nr:beta-eliminating lyase-related protein [Spirochaetales bacterium]
MRSFASDNNSGASPEIVRAVAAANEGHAVGYGDDPWTERARSLFKREFGPEAEAFFVLNGTGANVLALSLAAGPSTCVLCAEGAHIDVDETGAPEAAGIKVVPLAARLGKLEPEALREALGALGNVHAAQPSCLSISQPTERGAVYSKPEIEELCRIAHSAGLLVHVDGARLANAAVALGLPFRAFTVDAGVDLLSFGGMKNGLLFGEVLLVFRHELARRTPYLRKARLQLASKMRFVSAQYEAYLEGGLWKRNAEAANASARSLAGLVRGIEGVELEGEVETNALFARLSEDAAERLRQEYFFYDWEGGLVRWMTSFDTTEADIEGFAAALRRALSGT